MTLRKGHGNGKGVPRIEVLPADELPAPLPALPVLPTRRPDGTLIASEATKELARQGGYAKAQKKRLLQGMGLVDLVEDKVFTPYYKAAQAWLDATAQEYALMGGGRIGPTVMGNLGNAALCLAYARYLTDKAYKTDDELHARQALRYMDAMKQQELVAYELATREAKARAEVKRDPALDVFEQALKEQALAAETDDSE